MSTLKRKVNGNWETVASSSDFPVDIPVQITEVQANLTQLSATENGTYTPQAPYNGFNSVTVNVPSSGSNIVAYHGYEDSTAASYTATAVSVEISTTGNYKVSWCGCRNTTSGTSGSQLYITRNGSTSAHGSASTTFINSYFQSVVLNSVSLQAGDTITVYARARSASYHMMVGNLIAEKF